MVVEDIFIPQLLQKDDPRTPSNFYTYALSELEAIKIAIKSELYFR